MRVRAANLIGLIAAFLATACTPQPPSCSQPVAPRSVDGSTATERQMTQAHDAVVRFQKQSDDYQTCLVNAINEHHDHPPLFSRFYDDGVETAAENRKHDNQMEKERVVGEFNAGVRVYNTMHP